jgi:hypothetical protein
LRLERRRDQAQAFCRSALLVTEQTREMQRIEMPRFNFEDSPVEFLRLAETPQLVQRQRFLD